MIKANLAKRTRVQQDFRCAVDSVLWNKADVISFSAAMSACEKSSQWERAMRLLALLREHAVQETVLWM